MKSGSSNSRRICLKPRLKPRLKRQSRSTRMKPPTITPKRPRSMKKIKNQSQLSKTCSYSKIMSNFHLGTSLILTCFLTQTWIKTNWKNRRKNAKKKYKITFSASLRSTTTMSRYRIVRKNKKGKN